MHNRDPRQVPLVTGGARPIGDGVMATGQGENVVFYELVPWTFDTKVNQLQEDVPAHLVRGDPPAGQHGVRGDDAAAEAFFDSGWREGDPLPGRPLP